MFEKLEIFRMASAMATHASARQSTIAQNVANADTPGYLAKDVAAFSKVYENQHQGAQRATRAGHLHGQPAAAFSAETALGQGTLSPNGNNVSIEGEMVKAAEVRQQHEMAISIDKSSLGIMRSSLGRR